MVDIASNVQDYWSYVIGGDAVDLTTFKSEKTGRGLLVTGWQVCMVTVSGMFFLSESLIFVLTLRMGYYITGKA